MSYRLSLLDKSPVAAGRSAAEALRISLEAARLADKLGYHRYWLAEHHAIPGLASAAPEILISHILAQTKRIRVGSAGILLQHYSAYKVAELFSVLASLAPGRVDLGVGRSPGGLPRVTRALQKSSGQRLWPISTAASTILPHGCGGRTRGPRSSRAPKQHRRLFCWAAVRRRRARPAISAGAMFMRAITTAMPR
ncbi:MsnO8 family LLM class oxidoreductase [Paracoccus cavernae]|uniref:MsnO8 family LLM class oxidoreductase n=1 Tax=Paracoccus cavernae TaxID=1571207 RepID=UPI00363A661C